MWNTKFQFDGSNILFGKLSKKLNTTFSGYPISFYEKNKEFLITFVGNFDKSNEKEIITYLKKDKYVRKIEINNDFLIIQIKENLKYKKFYNSSFIYVSPVIIKNGIYHYHLASWNRVDLNKIISHVQLNFNAKIEFVKDKQLENISITNIKPNLTDKQKMAYDIAVENGYYNYPKEIELKELAKIMKVSYSTYQQHLKYAEKKLSEFYKSIK